MGNSCLDGILGAFVFSFVLGVGPADRMDGIALCFVLMGQWSNGSYSLFQVFWRLVRGAQTRLESLLLATCNV
jgi:hypothetical protein